MNLISLMVAIMLGVFGFVSCNDSSTQKPTQIVVNESDLVTKTVGVLGMTCVGCEVTLEKNIGEINGVVSVKASASNDKAVIEFDSTKTNQAIIKKAIEESGYKTF